jgi:hypothetical protein
LIASWEILKWKKRHILDDLRNILKIGAFFPFENSLTHGVFLVN